MAAIGLVLLVVGVVLLAVFATPVGCRNYNWADYLGTTLFSIGVVLLFCSLVLWLWRYVP